MVRVSLGKYIRPWGTLLLSELPAVDSFQTVAKGAAPNRANRNVGVNHPSASKQIEVKNEKARLRRRAFFCSL